MGGKGGVCVGVGGCVCVCICVCVCGGGWMGWDGMGWGGDGMGREGAVVEPVVAGERTEYIEDPAAVARTHTPMHDANVWVLGKAF